MNWKSTFCSERVGAEIQALPAGFLARFLRYAERMEVYGPDLVMPHTRAMGKGLFELRLKAEEGIARVSYCTVVEHQIMDAASIYQENGKDSPKGTQHRAEANEGNPRWLARSRSSSPRRWRARA